MERVLKDDDVSGSSFSSCQLDCEAIGLAARVDHHHLDTTKMEWLRKASMRMISNNAKKSTYMK